MDQDLELEQPSRYVVGIDLGTTNSALCYVDTREERWTVRTFGIPQLTAPSQVEARDNLPSFHYQPAEGEFSPGATKVPWNADEPGWIVGYFARDHGTLAPGRLIGSAKSWLCHPGVDRTADLLPWHGAPDVERLSPVEVSARYLLHLRQAWDASHPQDPLADQDVVLTLPASFDEVARELTVRAAARAGLPRVVLIEEPQAAFYAWIDAHRDDWETHVSPGQKILVCDVGGGTSDFTLIRVRRGEGDKIQFHRVAVGEHLILGGDNFDLALAHHIEQKLMGEGKLEPRQWATLVRTCRQVKETLLGPQPPDKYTVTLPGAGSKLIGGGLRTEVTREEAQQLLVDGFFPRVGLEDKPQGRRSGFQEFGLPYASDPAITRNLAAFLTAHRYVALDGEESSGIDPARPDIILFNGGVFGSSLLRDRLLDVIETWFRTPADSNWKPLVLQNARLDLAVARGAAYYGMVRRGVGIRIAAGLARTYYIGVESEVPSALCLVPAGAEPGQSFELGERRFHLRLSEPVEFPLFVSSTRLTDRPGELIAVDPEQMTALPPIHTVLRTAKKGESGEVAVELHARLTEIGTLDLWCGEVEGKGAWKLQFDVRSATRTDIAPHEAAAEREGVVEESVWLGCRREIEETFGSNGKAPPEGLMKRLAEVAGPNRREWPTSLLRRIWEVLLEFEAGRRKSQTHEARWLNLLGFALRPGYGLAADDWRVTETRNTLHGRLAHDAPMCRTEWWVLWRRIAGGLNPRQQQALVAPLLGPVRAVHQQLVKGKGRGAEFSSSTHETSEIWRMLGSLELLAVPLKIELGDILLDLIPKKKFDVVRPAMTWALGRIGARQPVYGPLNGVIPVDIAGNWIQRVLELRGENPTSPLAAMQLARRTGDRYRDIPDALREELLRWMQRENADPHFLQLVREWGSLDVEEQGLVFGEALPKGLRIL